MRKLVLWVALVLSLACATTNWKPRADEVSVTSAPGQFGWIEANKKTPQGNWGRDVTILVMIINPVRLSGTGCVVTINGEHSIHFTPNTEHVWTVTGLFAVGNHEVTVVVGDVTKTIHIHIWKAY